MYIGYRQQASFLMKAFGKLLRGQEHMYKKAMEWSGLVNQSMAMISDRKKPPFEGAREALELAKKYADIAIVTSANGVEIRKEWENEFLIQYTDLLASQETGRKAECLKELVEKGYGEESPDDGDSPIDLEAAREAGALFYPILAYQERESWEIFPDVLKQFLEGNYEGKMQDRCIEEFQGNLSI